MDGVTFGVVAEGPVDHLVIGHLLDALFLSLGTSAFVNELQPIAPAPGGWTQVFAYCASERIKEALAVNDFVIVQIDTDTCEHAGFDVPRSDPSGGAQDVQALIQGVRARLISVMPPSVQALVNDRVLFAISVNEIECWLLPWFTTKPAIQGKETGCLKALNAEFSRRFEFSIDPQNKQVKYYQRALSKVRLYKDASILTTAARQESLTVFLTDVGCKVAGLQGRAAN